MAKQKGIIKLDGTVGGITFYKSKDGYLAREKGGVSADKIANDPNFDITNLFEKAETITDIKPDTKNEKDKKKFIFGLNKYGTDLDRTDLSVLDWIQHAQEEHMDAILYLEKLKTTLATINQQPPSVCDNV